MTAALLAACQSNTFHIRGEAKGFQDGEILYIADGLNRDSLPTDSIIVAEGHFIFHGETDTVRFCRLYRAIDAQLEVTFFLEPGNIYVEMSAVPGRSRVSGTVINNGWQALNDEVAVCDRQLRRIIRDENIDRAAQAKALYDQIDFSIREMALKHKNNALGRFISTRYNTIDTE